MSYPVYKQLLISCHVAYHYNQDLIPQQSSHYYSELHLEEYKEKPPLQVTVVSTRHHKDSQV